MSNDSRLVELGALPVGIHEQAQVALHAGVVKDEPDPRAAAASVRLHKLQRLNLTGQGISIKVRCTVSLAYHRTACTVCEWVRLLTNFQYVPFCFSFSLMNSG